MKKHVIAIALILVIVCLCGCGIIKNKSGIIIRRDSEGLVELRIKNGAAELSFDLDKWENLYHINTAVAEIQPGRTLKSGPFSVAGLSGRVKDARIGKVAALDAYAEEITMPAVLLLMEDGGLEWFRANPFMPEFVSFGKVPWLKDIVSLSYENDGAGEMTIFAKNKSGFRYDVRTFCSLMSVFKDEWVYEIGPGHDGDKHCIFISFSEDGKLSFRKGLLKMGDAYLFYAGKYTVSNIGNKPVLALELWDEWELDMSNPDFSSPPLLSGKYFFKSDGVYLTLDLAEGDPMNSSDDKPVKEYRFWQPSMSDVLPDAHNDSESAGIESKAFYVLRELCEETINYFKMGMTPVFTGDSETIDGKLCWKVNVGTDHDEHFVTEFIYAVNLDSMQVYRYDALEDEWIPLAMG